ncbi:unnamed protein product, partial [Didymodactylos carnosus]
FDLKLWYLMSFKFISAVKLLGPKLFMIRNMVSDLSGFIYVMFVCIAAYGFVSRSLILYRDVDFIGRGIFRQIFYRPYWFLYSIVDDKTKQIDGIINNSTSGDYVAKATASHILLTFQMLFVNILILNLLIAVFTLTINKVQDDTEFIWRNQRYGFTREYVE